MKHGDDGDYVQAMISLKENKKINMLLPCSIYSMCVVQIGWIHRRCLDRDLRGAIANSLCVCFIRVYINKS